LLIRVRRSTGDGGPRGVSESVRESRDALVRDRLRAIVSELIKLLRRAAVGELLRMKVKGRKRRSNGEEAEGSRRRAHPTLIG
jgi:hypothetical protein